MSREFAHTRRSRIVLQKKLITHLLLACLTVEEHEFLVRKATFGESQADAIGVGRTARAIKSEFRHFRAVQ